MQQTCFFSEVYLTLKKYGFRRPLKLFIFAVHDSPMQGIAFSINEVENGLSTQQGHPGI